MIKKLLIAGFALFHFINLCSSQNYFTDLPNQIPKIAVLIQEIYIDSKTKEKKSRSMGTGLWYGTDKWVYLITAKHVLFTQIENDKFKLNANDLLIIWYPEGFEEKKPSKYYINISCAIVNNDIIVSEPDLVAVKILRIKGDLLEFSKGVNSGIKIDLKKSVKTKRKRTLILVNKDLCGKSFEDVQIASDIIMFGFPNSLERYYDYLGTEVQYDPFNPLFKKGIIAAKYSKKETFILDCSVFGGNSGGPVFLIDQPSVFEKRYYLIGIVTRYVPYLSKSRNEQGIVTNINIQNSGYSVVEPINKIIEKIDMFEKNIK